MAIGAMPARGWPLPAMISPSPIPVEGQPFALVAAGGSGASH
jgi:hypothetical protein